MKGKKWIIIYFVENIKLRIMKAEKGNAFKYITWTFLCGISPQLVRNFYTGGIQFSNALPRFL